MQFLHALAEHGLVRRAARVAGMSAQAAYLLRRRDPLFARGWDAALCLALPGQEQVLAERAIYGVEETVWFRGEAVGSRTRFDARLLLAHLARLDKRCEAQPPEAAIDAGAFDALLAHLAANADPAEWHPPAPRAEVVEQQVYEASAAYWDALEDQPGEDDAATAEALTEEADDEAGEGDELDALLGDVRDRAGAAWDEAFGAAVASVDAAVAGVEVKSAVPPPSPFDKLRRTPPPRGEDRDAQILPRRGRWRRAAPSEGARPRPAGQRLPPDIVNFVNFGR